MAAFKSADWGVQSCSLLKKRKEVCPSSASLSLVLSPGRTGQQPKVAGYHGDWCRVKVGGPGGREASFTARLQKLQVSLLLFILRKKEGNRLQPCTFNFNTIFLHSLSGYHPSPFLDHCINTYPIYTAKWRELPGMVLRKMQIRLKISRGSRGPLRPLGGV